MRINVQQIELAKVRVLERPISDGIRKLMNGEESTRVGTKPKSKKKKIKRKGWVDMRIYRLELGCAVYKSTLMRVIFTSL